jgi:ABC-type multidrug transport system fused ATPase/permease subunit
VEAAILAGLRENGTPTSVVVVAYRKATISLADEVVYIEHGRVLDRGSHLELLARSEAYRHLVNAYDEEATSRAAAVAAELDEGVGRGDAQVPA